MSLIKPFDGLCPQAQYTAQVAAPPYDVLNTQEARLQAVGKPWSFLHISKPEIDLPPQTDPYSPQVYIKGAENLHRMLSEGVLRREGREIYYLYNLTMGSHTQTGLVAAASVEAYNANRIRKHEFTRPDKEDDRVRQIDALNAQTGPVLLAHRPDPAVAELSASLTLQEPHLSVTGEDGVTHKVWKVEAHEHIAFFTERFQMMDSLYIADGHHRSAAAARVTEARKQNNPSHTGQEAYNYFLTVIFPTDCMQILDYNRVVRDLNGLSLEAFIEKIKMNFQVEDHPVPFKPSAHGEVGMYMAGALALLTYSSG